MARRAPPARGRAKGPLAPPMLKAPPMGLGAPPMGLGAGPMGGPMGMPPSGPGGPSAAGMAPPRGYAKGTGLKPQKGDPDARDDAKEKAMGNRGKDPDKKMDLKGYAKGTGITLGQATGGITRKVPNSGGITKGVPPSSGITKGQATTGITKGVSNFSNKQRAPMGTARPSAPRNAGVGRTAKGK